MTDPKRPDTEPITLGGLIRAAREEQGLSASQLAALVGVDRSLLHRWERDVWVPKAKHLVGLARALDLPIADLQSISGVDFPTDQPSLPAMLRAEYDLPPEAIDQVERYVARLARKHRNTSSSESTRQEGGTS